MSVLWEDQLVVRFLILQPQTTPHVDCAPAMEKPLFCNTNTFDTGCMFILSKQFLSLVNL